MSFINVADLIDPNDKQGRSYRQVNSEKIHNIPLGSLVEIVTEQKQNGVRMFVVFRGRDCDKTPLYWLSGDLDFEDRGIFNKWFGGWSEESLKVITTGEEGMVTS